MRTFHYINTPPAKLFMIDTVTENVSLFLNCSPIKYVSRRSAAISEVSKIKSKLRKTLNQRASRHRSSDPTFSSSNDTGKGLLAYVKTFGFDFNGSRSSQKWTVRVSHYFTTSGALERQQRILSISGDRSRELDNRSRGENRSRFPCWNCWFEVWWNS